MYLCFLRKTVEVFVFEKDMCQCKVMALRFKDDGDGVSDDGVMGDGRD